MIHTILELARLGILKTHVTYRANLSHHQLTKFLELLLNHHLLTRDQHLFVTTARGCAFIEAFHEIQAILGETSEAYVSSFAN